MSLDIRLEDFGVMTDLRAASETIKYAEETGQPLIVDGERYYIASSAIKRRESYHYNIGLRQGREELQEELRELLGVDASESTMS